MTIPFDWRGDEAPDPPETCLICDGSIEREGDTTCFACRHGYTTTYSIGATDGQLCGKAARRGRWIHDEDEDAVEREGRWENGVRGLEDLP